MALDLPQIDGLVKDRSAKSRQNLNSPKTVPRLALASAFNKVAPVNDGGDLCEIYLLGL